MTKEQYSKLDPQMQVMAELGLEILRELKGINRQVEQIESDEVKVH